MKPQVSQMQVRNSITHPRLYIVCFLILLASHSQAQDQLDRGLRENVSSISVGAGIGTLEPVIDQMYYLDFAYHTNRWDKALSLGISLVGTRYSVPRYSGVPFARKKQIALDISNRIFEGSHSNSNFKYGFFLGPNIHYRRSEKYLETITSSSLENLMEFVNSKYPSESINPRYYGARFYSFLSSELTYPARITRHDNGLGLGAHVGLYGDFLFKRFILGLRFKATVYHQGASHWGPSFHLGWVL